MLDSEEYSELGINKWYNTSTERALSENGSIEEKLTGNSS